MSEKFGEARIRIIVYGRLVDIIELKVPVDIRSDNKKRLGSQRNDHRLTES
jgi:hypothetical protein